MMSLGQLLRGPHPSLFNSIGLISAHPIRLISDVTHVRLTSDVTLSSEPPLAVAPAVVAPVMSVSVNSVKHQHCLNYYYFHRAWHS